MLVSGKVNLNEAQRSWGNERTGFPAQKEKPNAPGILVKSKCSYSCSRMGEQGRGNRDPGWEERWALVSFWTSWMTTTRRFWADGDMHTQEKEVWLRCGQSVPRWLWTFANPLNVTWNSYKTVTKADACSFYCCPPSSLESQHPTGVK